MHALDRLAERPHGLEPASGANTYRGRLARMKALEQAHGGPREAAAAVGVQYRTWKLWGSRLARPTARSIGKLKDSVGAVYRAIGLRRALRRMPQPTMSAVINWDGYRVRWGTPPGYRTTTLDRMDGLHMVKLWGPWMAGDTGRLAGLFEASVAKEYGNPVNFEGDNVKVEWQ
jgi:hypothetical protein